MSAPELRPLFLDELEPVIALHRETWSPGVPVDAFRRAYMELLRTRWARGHVQIMGWFEGGRLTSSFRLYRLEMLIDGHKRTCAGIGTVLTLPDRRHRGHASTMLRAACDVFRSQYSVCAIFSTTGPRFYRELGFFPLPNMKYVLVRQLPGIAVAPRAGRNGALTRRRASVPVEERLQAQACPYTDDDLADVVGIYNLDVSLRKIGILRSEAYWHHLFEKERIQRTLLTVGDAPEEALRTWLCRVDDRTTSYITVRTARDRMQIVESPTESFQFQSWLLRWAISLSRSENIPRIESQVPLRSNDGEVRIVVRRDSLLMMMHPLGSGLRAEDFPYPAENFLWSRDRF